MFGLKLTSAVLLLSLAVASFATPVVRSYPSLTLMSCSHLSNTSRKGNKITVVNHRPGVATPKLILLTSELPTGWAVH